MRYIDPNQPGSKVQFKSQYENFIGGEWVAPVKVLILTMYLLLTEKLLHVFHALVPKISNSR